MEILFNEKIAKLYDRWAETPQGGKAYGLEGELILSLGRLGLGQKVLEVGYGTGLHLEIFLKEGLKVFGVDVSPHMLRLAKKRLGKDVRLCLANAEKLPFKEKTFDGVMLVTTLEFLPNPSEAIQEALRVSRGKILLGVLNRFSLPGITRRVKGKFRPSIYDRARFYTIWELRRLIMKALHGAVIDWASVLVLPISW